MGRFVVEPGDDPEHGTADETATERSQRCPLKFAERQLSTSAAMERWSEVAAQASTSSDRAGGCPNFMGAAHCPGSRAIGQGSTARFRRPDHSRRRADVALEIQRCRRSPECSQTHAKKCPAQGRASSQRRGRERTGLLGAIIRTPGYAFVTPIIPPSHSWPGCAACPRPCRAPGPCGRPATAPEWYAQPHSARRHGAAYGSRARPRKH